MPATLSIKLDKCWRILLLSWSSLTEKKRKRIRNWYGISKVIFCKLICQQKRPLSMFFKKGLFKNFAIFTEKHLCWSPTYGGCFWSCLKWKQDFSFSEKVRLNQAVFLKKYHWKQLWDYVMVFSGLMLKNRLYFYLNAFL